VSDKPDFETIDGYKELVEKVEASGMRHLFRYSGTENKMRILLEGKDEKKLDDMMDEAVSFFKKALV
jgi:phosphoglucosamine mutase